MQRPILFLVTVVLAAPAWGIVVDGANQQRFARAPADDPGWAHVGRRGFTSAIYLGDGWVLTAGHSGPGDVSFGKETYPPVPDSMIRLENADGSKADLILFRIAPAPDLPRLPLRQHPPPTGARAMLIGYGLGRGDPIDAGEPGGFVSVNGGIKRWGLNNLMASRFDVPGPGQTRTRCFAMDFSKNGVHEGHAAVGDSGGAVFVRGSRGRWRLGGVMLSIGRPPDQPDGIAIFGNQTHAADVAVYADQILASIGWESSP